jgi:hypothetical protein
MTRGSERGNPRSTLDLTFVDAKLLLEALQALEGKRARICETSTDEDEVSDYGNDLVELRLLQASTRDAAVSSFGKNVTNFDRTPL